MWPCSSVNRSVAEKRECCPAEIRLIDDITRVRIALSQVEELLRRQAFSVVTPTKLIGPIAAAARGGWRTSHPFWPASGFLLFMDSLGRISCGRDSFRKNLAIITKRHSRERTGGCLALPCTEREPNGTAIRHVPVGDDIHKIKESRWESQN